MDDTTNPPVRRTCHGCGAPTDSAHVRVTPDLVRGGEHVWGVCEPCNAPDEALSAAVVAEVLELDLADEVLAGILVERFGDRLDALPNKPNGKPWAHLDRAILAAEVAARRADLERRRSDNPCYFCGTTVTPRGEWKHSRTSSGRRSVCGACSEQFAGGENRDRAAAVLGGLQRAGSTHIPYRLGSNVNLLYWHETGRRTGAPRPWAHLDLARLRGQIADLAASRAINELPHWWNAERPVKW